MTFTGTTKRNMGTLYFINTKSITFYLHSMVHKRVLIFSSLHTFVHERGLRMLNTFRESELSSTTELSSTNLTELSSTKKQGKWTIELSSTKALNSRLLLNFRLLNLTELSSTYEFYSSLV